MVSLAVIEQVSQMANATALSAKITSFFPHSSENRFSNKLVFLFVLAT